MNAAGARLRARARRRQAGMSLIEVLAALLVLTFGLLGTVAMQARSMRLTTDSQDRMRAAMLANEIVAQMWAANSTTPSNEQLDDWKLRVADSAGRGLPAGAISLEYKSIGGVITTTITITWVSLAHGSKPATYVTQLAM